LACRWGCQFVPADILSHSSVITWKTATKSCHFYNKEHLDFPVDKYNYIDIITFAISLTGKLHAH